MSLVCPCFAEVYPFELTLVVLIKCSDSEEVSEEVTHRVTHGCLIQSHVWSWSALWWTTTALQQH